MDVEFNDDELRKLALDPTFKGRWDWKIKTKFQRTLLAFDTINRRENLFALSGMKFELLTGKRKGLKKKKYDKEYSVRLDGRNRVVLSFVGPVESETIVITFVGDYH